MKKVHDADGIAAAVNFKLSPGIRGPEHTHAGYSCVDEKNCDEEVYFLCGQSLGGGVDFLECMDTTSGSVESIVKSCASKSSLDWSSISKCFSGDQGSALKKAAATHFDTKFPQPVGVPRVEINGKMQSERTEAALIKALCATGIQAGACTSTELVV